MLPDPATRFAEHYPHHQTPDLAAQRVAIGAQISQRIQPAATGKRPYAVPDTSDGALPMPAT